MSRANWKGPCLQKSVIEFVNNQKIEEKRFSPMLRKTVIVPSLVGKTFSVYNGKIFIKVKITYDMVGCKFGEFSPTRKQFTYKKKKK